MTINKYLEKIAGLIRTRNLLESRAGSLVQKSADRIRKINQGLSDKPFPHKANITAQTLNNQLSTGLFKKASLPNPLKMKPLGKLPVLRESQGAPRFALAKSNPKKIGGTRV